MASDWSARTVPKTRVPKTRKNRWEHFLNDFCSLYKYKPISARQSPKLVSLRLLNGCNKFLTDALVGSYSRFVHDERPKYSLVEVFNFSGNILNLDLNIF